MQKHPNSDISHQASWLVLLIITLGTIALRYNLLEVPLERDEGEYAYAGQLILQGIPPYQEMYNMKLPGIYVIYAGILALLGQTHSAIHLGLLIFNIATTIVLFLLGSQLANRLTGLVAAASFAVLSVGQSVQGVFANAEHFLIFPAAGGALLLVSGLEKNQLWRICISGLLIGIGFIIKQHGVAFILMGIGSIFMFKYQNKKIELRHMTHQCVIFTIGSIIPYGIICIILWQLGIFNNFWFWTIDYAKAYTSLVSFNDAWLQLKNQFLTITGSTPLLWTLAGVGIIAVIWDQQSKNKAYFIIPFIIFSILSIFPGFYFRPHYFILTLPAAALLCGIAVKSLNELLPKNNKTTRQILPLIAVGIILTATIYQQRIFLFKLSPTQASRVTYWPNPFPESLEISKYISKHSEEKDKIAVIGSEPQIYFYSGRKSASGYIYMYALMENHEYAKKMQTEMIKEVEKARPKFLIFVRITYSWLQNKKSPTNIFEWYKEYSNKYYDRVGLIDIFSDTTIYHWKPDFIPWQPRSPYWIEVLKRRENIKE